MIAIAAFSARLLAEAAAADGMPAVALDLFGDVDTRRAAVEWRPIGAASGLRIDGERLLAALSALAQRGDVQGWVAGSGLECDPALLAEAAQRLPLIGTRPDDVRRLRDPVRFFRALDRLGIAYPDVRHAAPASRAGWLLKNPQGCGGWRVQAAETAPPVRAEGDYWQRRRPGRPMSATFVANGEQAVLLGFNQQTTCVIGDRPFVYCGLRGPVEVGSAARRDIAAGLQRLCAEFGLRGLGSLDFMLDGEVAEVLEINPRPPASTELYPRVGAGGPLRAHLRACLQGELPAILPAPSAVRGTEILFATSAFTVDEAVAAGLARAPGVHDLPGAGSVFGAGDPVCSLSASGADLAQLRNRLAQYRDHVERLIGVPA